MTKKLLKTKDRRVVARIEIDSQGIHRITDEHHRGLPQWYGSGH